MTNLSWFNQNVLVLALKAPQPWNPLSPRWNETADYPNVVFESLQILVLFFKLLSVSSINPVLLGACPVWSSSFWLLGTLIWLVISLYLLDWDHLGLACHAQGLGMNLVISFTGLGERKTYKAYVPVEGLAPLLLCFYRVSRRKQSQQWMDAQSTWVPGSLELDSS